MTLRFPTVLIALILPRLAAAQSAAPELGASVLQMILGLGVVLLLVFASLYLLKRLAAPRGAASSLLRVIATANLGPRERVVVLELADTWLVLGTAPGSVTALTQMPRQELPPAPPPPGKDFASWLKLVSDRRNGR